MENITEISLLILGLFIGGAAIYLIFKNKAQAQFELGAAKSENELIRLQEQANAKNEQLSTLQPELENYKQNLENQKSQNLQFEKQISELSESTKNKDVQISELKSQLKNQSKNLENIRNENSELKADLSRTETTLEDERKQTEARLKDLQDAKERLTTEFKNIANEIFEEKSQKFTQQNKEKLDGVLKPLSEKIRDFEQKVTDTYDKESKDRTSLAEQIKQLATLNTKISTDAINLTNALKGESKTLGNWGEMILERVLEKSGLTRDREYIIQQSLKTEDGRRLQPDVVIYLPEKKHLVVDSKVSLNAYERFCSTEDKKLREIELKKHIFSIREHIKELSIKEYQNLYELHTLDFVLMFIPIEPAFSLAVQADVDLFQEAFDRNIVIVCPSTLLATLRTISSIWRQEYQNRNAIEIARQSGNLFDKFVGFVNSLEEIGSRLEKAQNAYHDAHKKLTSGRGNLIKKAEDIKKLGVKTSKSLPENLIEAGQ